MKKLMTLLVVTIPLLVLFQVDVFAEIDLLAYPSNPDSDTYIYTTVYSYTSGSDTWEFVVYSTSKMVCFGQYHTIQYRGTYIKNYHKNNDSWLSFNPSNSQSGDSWTDIIYTNYDLNDAETGELINGDSSMFAPSIIPPDNPNADLYEYYYLFYDGNLIYSVWSKYQADYFSSNRYVFVENDGDIQSVVSNQGLYAWCTYEYSINEWYPDHYDFDSMWEHTNGSYISAGGYSKFDIAGHPYLVGTNDSTITVQYTLDDLITSDMDIDYQINAYDNLSILNIYTNFSYDNMEIDLVNDETVVGTYSPETNYLLCKNIAEYDSTLDYSFDLRFYLAGDLLYSESTDTYATTVSVYDESSSIADVSDNSHSYEFNAGSPPVFPSGTDNILDYVTYVFNGAGYLVNYFVSGISYLFGLVGDMVNVFTDIFSFLPPEITIVMSLGILIAVLLRIFGR